MCRWSRRCRNCCRSGLALMTRTRWAGRPELASVAAFPLETAFAAVSLMTNGISERCPKQRILLSHGGGALPWILPLLRQARTIGPPLDSLFPREPDEMAKAVYFYA